MRDRRTAGGHAASPGLGAIVGSEPWVGAVSSAGSSAWSSVWLASVPLPRTDRRSRQRRVRVADVSVVGLLARVGRRLCAVLGLRLLTWLIRVIGTSVVVDFSGGSVVVPGRLVGLDDVEDLCPESR